MQVVYLDQSHISRMAKGRLGIGGRPEDTHVALLSELERLTGAGKVICPYSLWHVMETADHDNDDVRAEVCRIVGRLSGGLCFRFPSDVVDDEIARVVRTRPERVDAIGTGSDCFPAESLEAETRTHFRDLEPEDRFGALVLAVRQSPDIRMSLLRDFKSKTITLETAAAAIRKASGIPRAEAAVQERASVLADAIERGARRLGIHSDDIRERLGNLDAVPTLVLLAETYGLKGSDPDRVARSSDPVDLGHLLAFPYCDLVLTERYLAALTTDTLRRLSFEPKPVIVSDATEFLKRLAA